MVKPARRRVVGVILERYPLSHAAQLRIHVARNTPAPLFQWLLASMLFSARIDASLAQTAVSALLAAGWRTPKKMHATTWKQRVRVLNRAGYARYDESTARYIGDSTEHLLTRYRGDLRRLRKEAGGDRAAMRRALRQFKGIGDVGIDIFFREAQLAWPELYPFADRKALQAASALGLGRDTGALAHLVPRRDLPRLLSGLVRVGLAGEEDDILEQAS